MSFYKGKNVLVTGAAGIAGHSTVKKLLDLGANVRATVFTSKKLNIPDNPRLEIVKCNLHSYDQCLQITKDMDIVFNLVAYIRGAKSQVDAPINLVRNNIVPAVNMMDASVKSKVDRFGFIGSSTMYPDVEYPVLETEAFSDEPHPAYTGVGWMKRYSEKVIEHFNDISNTKFAIVRTTAMYGPHDSFNERGHVIPQLILKADKGLNPFPVWGDGSQVRDFVHVDDVIDALLLVTEKNPTATAYNVASGTPTTVKELVETIVGAYGYNPKIEYDITKPSMIPKRLVNVSKIKDDLGWEAKTNLKSGIEDTVNWYRSNKHLN
jgi:GDP-L-fucose synthase